MENKKNKEIEELKEKQDKEMKELEERLEKEEKVEEEKQDEEKEKNEPHKAVEPEEDDLADKVSGKIIIIAGILIVIAIIVFAGYKIYAGANDEVNNLSKDGFAATGDAVKLDFYVMSQCPSGTQVENGIAPVLEMMGEDIDLSIEYIATYLDNGSFRSLHGQPEVDENIRQLCAIKHNPKEYMDYIICQNKDIMNADKNFEKCAEEAEIDIESVTECFEGEEGTQLLKESIKNSEEVEATGSPTIYLNGEPYEGGRDPASFQTAICKHIENPACDELPACSADSDCEAKEGFIARCENPGTADAECTYVQPTTVYLVILNDDDCTTCDTTRVVEVSKQLFPGVEIQEVDVKTDEGKAVVENYDLTYIPAYIFSSEIEETVTWETNAQIKGSFENAGDNYKLKDAATGASTFIDKEKESEYLDSIGITLDDNKPQMDFFIMSYCPYGNQAEELIEPVYQLLGEYADFNPHWVIYSNYRGGGPDYCIDEDSLYCSMHGVTEVNEDMREQCVLIEYDMDKFWEFIIAMNSECTSSNADTCWKDVAEGMDIDVDTIEECFDDNALDIAAADLELGGKLGVTGSPTIFIDGQKFAGQRTAEGYKSALCAAFDDAPDECSEQIESSGAAASTGQC